MPSNEYYFRGRLNHSPMKDGWVDIWYANKPSDESGLWINCYHGYKNDGQSFAWNIPVPDPNLLMTAASVALGVMPPWVFADWLEDRAESILSQLRQFDGYNEADIAKCWHGVLFHLRRLVRPEPLSSLT